MNSPEDLPPPGAWIAALDRADADVATGRTRAGEGIMRRLRRTLADIGTRTTGEPLAMLQDGATLQNHF